MTFAPLIYFRPDFGLVSGYTVVTPGAARAGGGPNVSGNVSRRQMCIRDRYLYLLLFEGQAIEAVKEDCKAEAGPVPTVLNSNSSIL